MVTLGQLEIFFLNEESLKKSTFFKEAVSKIIGFSYIQKVSVTFKFFRY